MNDNRHVLVAGCHTGTTMDGGCGFNGRVLVVSESLDFGRETLDNTDHLGVRQLVTGCVGASPEDPFIVDFILIMVGHAVLRASRRYFLNASPP